MWNDYGSEPNYDLAVVIGRFQPFHTAHANLVASAYKHSNNVLVIIGSAGIARDIRNPFTYEERVAMIKAAYPNVAVAPVIDELYNDQLWCAQVQAAVDQHLEGIENPKVALIGHKKDDTSYYLDLFPKYKYSPHDFIVMPDGTEIRKKYFGRPKISLGGNLLGMFNVPESTRTFLEDFQKTEAFKNLWEEYDFNVKYKKQFEGYAYPPVFVTTDAVVINNGYILLVRRKSNPGKGLWALPGGFLGTNERIVDSIIRELVEETKIKVPEKILRGSLKSIHYFDAPGRSLRGRTITHAGLIVLHNKDLPEVKGADDAEVAKWIPISDFYNMSDQLFEDHYSIGQFMINRAN